MQVVMCGRDPICCLHRVAACLRDTVTCVLHAGGMAAEPDSCDT